jgi:hypothetical protein
MKMYGAVAVKTHVLLTSALVGGEWSASRLAALPPEESVSDSHWLDPRAGLVGVETRKSLTLPGLELRLRRSACSQSLYRLSYRGDRHLRKSPGND